MKNLLYIILIFTFMPVLCYGKDTKGGWTESGELEYSYAYARTWLGYQMRKDGWSCKIGFTAGRYREQEHSVWIKGTRKMQVMIWKIDSNRTGYSKGEISGQESKEI